MTASVSPSRELALAINRWVTAADGMNMVYDPHTVEQSAEEVMASPVRHGDCTEFTMVLLALLNRAGFQAYPIWVGRDLFGDEVQHFMVGVDVGGETLTFDPVYASFDPDYGVNPSHQTSLRAPMTTLLAWHWINRGNDLRDSNHFDAAEAAYRRAAMIDPANPHILLNQGVSRSGRAALALLSGDRTEARRWFQSAREDLSAALRLDPAFHQAYYAWGNLELDAGRSGVAVSYYRRAVSMAPNEPRYRCDLILALIRSDQRALARSELRYLEVHHSDFLADFLDQPDDDGRSTPRQRIEAALGSH